MAGENITVEKRGGVGGERINDFCAAFNIFGHPRLIFGAKQCQNFQRLNYASGKT